MQTIVVKYLSMVLLSSAACLFPHDALARQIKNYDKKG